MMESSTVLPPPRRAIVTVIVMASALMTVLDATIANVALPHMQAALGATPESIAWVLTSYIVASAIAIPLTGWLANRIGRKLLFAVALVGFTLSSATCGLATSLGMMVAARLTQGLFGAFLVPLSQALMYDINPPERHAFAMMIWGMAVMIGPIMGPVLGGYLTESFDWRWVFFINVPIGIVAAIGAVAMVPDSPILRQRFDALGYALIATALCSFQLMLDRGTQLDWFSSAEIVIELGLAIAAAWMLGIHLWMKPDGIVRTALLRDANFVTALVITAVIGGVLLAGSALIAPMLQRLLNYSVFDAGLLVMPRGVGTLLGFVVAGRLVTRLDGRYILLVGLLVIAWSLHMMTGFNLEMDARLVIVSGVIQGVGLGLVVMPMNLLAFSTLSPALRTEGAAIYNLMRNIGGSIAIAATSAMLAANIQTSHADLGAHVTSSSMLALSGLAAQLGYRGATALQFIDAELNRQAAMIGYIDDYWMMMWVTIVLAPCVFLMRRQRLGERPEHIGE